MTPIESNILNKTIRIIVDYINPDKLILFGSRAKNKNADINSDYDICILKNNISEKRKTTQELYKLLYSTGAAIDLIIETPEKFNELKTENSFIYYQIDKYGKVIYEKK
ncbi:MAG: nucleotidyltransferase domain-containing protein [Bacteroidales bacterium]